jgi:hypothetical protein
LLAYGLGLDWVVNLIGILEGFGVWPRRHQEHTADIPSLSSRQISNVVEVRRRRIKKLMVEENTNNPR